MLKNQNIICISSIDWDFIWQGHQEIMSALAQNGNRVLFIENTGVRTLRIRDIPRIKSRIKNWFKGVKGIRKEMENLYIFSPITIPFPYFRPAQWINSHTIISTLERWMKITDFTNPIIWTFLPTPLSLKIIKNLTKQLLIYYCIDNFSVSSISAKKILKSEKRMLKEADLVFVTSQALHNYCSAYNKNTYIFPFAVSFKEFEKARIEEKGTNELKDFKKPIIGYVGGIHKWINQELIKEMATKFKDYSFVFIGPIQTDVSLLSGLKNIYFLGKKEHTEIPFYINNFDVCIIPYLITDYTQNVYPSKLNEYLAMGKAVVSTQLPEIIAFRRRYGDVVAVARDNQKFAEYIKNALSQENIDLKAKRIEVAKENSWENRIKKMSELIIEMSEKKKRETEEHWKENLIYFYRASHRKLVKVIAICSLSYLFIFKTPFIWFCAQPLKITDEPRPADAIVVFAGGVGESGEAGQGYEERVNYAVELFKKGYAHNLIFSSGYKYIFKEPEVMKALAISMGVPEKNIILEEKGRNTYEMVKFTKEILESHSLRSILLVSSPYHMLRATLTFKKNAENILVIPTPIPLSHFYLHAYGISLRQLKGIIHEYLGFFYYFYKEWI